MGQREPVRRWGLESSRFDGRYEISGLGGLSGVRWYLDTAYKNAKYQQKILKSCCCSFAQSCLTLCDPVDCGTPGLPSPSPSPGTCSHSCPLSPWCHPTILSSVVPFSSCLQSFPASGSFPVSQLFPSGVQSTGASALASVLPVNIQDWFLLGLTGLISLQSKGLLRIFSSTPHLKSINSSVLRFLYNPPLMSKHDYLKKHSFD